MIVFFILSFVCILSSILLITNKNPVYSVLSLVLLFICGSILLLLLGIDFLPYVFVVVYVGAVAVLFLFVVIILDIKLARNNSNLKHIPITFIISFGIFLFLNYVSQFFKHRWDFDLDFYSENVFLSHGQNFTKIDDGFNLTYLGQILYTQYIVHFVICGLILLVAIIGAIVLTSRRRQRSLKQKVFKQVERLNIVGKNKNA